MPGSLNGVVFETVEGHLSILADLDEVSVGITHVAAPAALVKCVAAFERWAQMLAPPKATPWDGPPVSKVCRVAPSVAAKR